MKSVAKKIYDSTVLLLFGVIAFALFSAVQPAACLAQDASTFSSATDVALEPQAAAAYSPEQLDQLLAPIALYPDSLVGDVLMASTYPLEVVEAYRWQQQSGNANLQGDGLQATLDQASWDPSVKALVAFPQLLKTLNDNLQWMEQLGDAFLAQQPDVMNEIQHLRQSAEGAGTLASTPQQVVSTQGSDILIEPTNPDVVYVPSYNPLYAYGSWPYADYQPYYFQGYASTGSGLVFGYGIAVAEWFWGWNRWDWRNHRLDIDDRRFAELNRGRPPRGGQTWEYDPAHRHDEVDSPFLSASKCHRG